MSSSASLPCFRKNSYKREKLLSCLPEEGGFGASKLHQCSGKAVLNINGYGHVQCIRFLSPQPQCKVSQVKLQCNHMSVLLCHVTTPFVKVIRVCYTTQYFDIQLGTHWNSRAKHSHRDQGSLLFGRNGAATSVDGMCGCRATISTPLTYPTILLEDRLGY